MTAESSLRRPRHPCVEGRLRTEMHEIMKLAIPTVLGLVSTVAMGVIDTAMLAPLGSDVVAAVGLSTSALIFVHSAMIGFVSVIGVSVARAVGTGDTAQVSMAVSSGAAFAIMLALGALIAMGVAVPLVASLAPSPEVGALTQTYWLTLTFAVVPHTLLAAFRGVYTALGRPWIALCITLVGIGLNVPFNQLLIHGGAGLEGFGILGAGLASVLAKTLAAVLFVGHWRRYENSRGPRDRVRLSFRSVASLARDGLPVAAGSVAEGGAYAMTGLMAAMLGSAALAAHQIVHSIGVLFYMVPIGMMITSSIRTGQLFGAGRTPEISCTLLVANCITLIWSICVLSFVLAFRLPIAALLGPAQDVTSLAASLFLIMAFVQFADCVQSNALGVLRGIGDNVLPNAVTVAAYWLFALPLAACLGWVFGFGVVGISLGYGFSVLVAGSVLQVRAAKLSKLL